MAVKLFELGISRVSFWVRGPRVHIGRGLRAWAVHLAATKASLAFRAILVARARFTGLQHADARLARPAAALLARAGLALHIAVRTNVREGRQELAAARFALFFFVDLDDDAVDRRQRVISLLAVLDAAPFR